MKNNEKKNFWQKLLKKMKEKKAKKNEKEVIKYHNEVKIEMPNLAENDEFLISSAIAFVSTIGESEKNFDTVRKMVTEEIEDFRDTNPKERTIIFKMFLDDLVFSVESSKKG